MCFRCTKSLWARPSARSSDIVFLMCKDIQHHVQSQKELSEQGAMPPFPRQLSRTHIEIPADVSAPPWSSHWLAFASRARFTSYGQRLVKPLSHGLIYSRIMLYTLSRPCHTKLLSHRYLLGLSFEEFA